VRTILRFLVTVLALTLPGLSGAQEEEHIGPVIRGNLGVIVNSSYSNISEKEEAVDDFSQIRRTKSDSAPPVKVGFIIGIEALLGKKDGFRGVFGFSLARSAAHYHSSFTEVSATTRLGFTQMSRATELDYKESYFYADFLAGIRNKLFPNVYLTSALAFNKPMFTRRESSGYILTTYSTPGSPDTESTVAYITDPKKKVKGDSNLSLRLRLEYQFQLSQSKAGVFVFRNLGLIYTLPWWGVGLTVAF
jgi:hypothetical protein